MSLWLLVVVAVAMYFQFVECGISVGYDMSQKLNKLRYAVKKDYEGKVERMDTAPMDREWGHITDETGKKIAKMLDRFDLEKIRTSKDNEDWGLSDYAIQSIYGWSVSNAISDGIKQTWKSGKIHWPHSSLGVYRALQCPGSYNFINKPPHSLTLYFGKTGKCTSGYLGDPDLILYGPQSATLDYSTAVSHAYNGFVIEIEIDKDSQIHGLGGILDISWISYHEWEREWVLYNIPISLMNMYYDGRKWKRPKKINKHDPCFVASPPLTAPLTASLTGLPAKKQFFNYYDVVNGYNGYYDLDDQYEALLADYYRDLYALQKDKQRLNKLYRLYYGYNKHEKHKKTSSF